MVWFLGNIRVLGLLCQIGTLILWYPDFLPNWHLLNTCFSYTQNRNSRQISVNLCNLWQNFSALISEIFSLRLGCVIRVKTFLRRDTSDQRRDTASAKRAGTLDQNPKKMKIFYNFLTPYFTTSYIFSVSSVTSVANVFFVPNAQVRPFIEGRSFSAPSDIVWDLGVLFWTFKFEKFEFVSEYGIFILLFRVQCSVFRVQSSVFRVQCSVFSVQCSEFSVQSYSLWI